jgi:hypothetical protein
MKATPTTIASNSNGVSTASVSDAGDVTMTSPIQNKELLNKNSILPNKDPPEGKPTAIIAVMMVNLNMVTTTTAVTITTSKN